jgi:hypothetical protein
MKRGGGKNGEENGDGNGKIPGGAPALGADGESPA